MSSDDAINCDLRISPRDYFAGLAMQALINIYTKESMLGEEEIASWSYQQADAMLNAKKNGAE